MHYAGNPVITIIMYHYVRDLSKSKYPNIKGLSIEAFEKQLSYIKQNYNAVDIRDIILAIRGIKKLLPNACLLTFDDAFIDHYIYVYPRLIAQGLKGTFFPPAVIYYEDTVLDVHKIHFILAVESDINRIIKDLFKLMDHFDETCLFSKKELYHQYAKPGRFDNRDINFVKQLLQSVLPENMRCKIINELFSKYVSSDEKAFAQELYMSIPMIQELVDNGMTIGGHGYSHKRLGMLSPQEQTIEIEKTRLFLNKIHDSEQIDWVLSYPHGNWNKDTLKILTSNDCAIALTINVGKADICKPLELNRFAPNHFPF